MGANRSRRPGAVVRTTGRRSLVAALAVTTIFFGFGAAAPAAAAGIVEVSPDGTTYSSTFSGALFDTTKLMVPGGSEHAVFYFRNVGADPGFMRITLTDVISTDPLLSDALTITTSTSGHPGSPVAMSKPDPCWVLLEGQTVAPGQIVAVSAVLNLGDLQGEQGQDADIQMSIEVELSDTATGSLPPTACGKNTVVVPVVPPTGTTKPPKGSDSSDPGTSNGGTPTDPETDPDEELPSHALGDVLPNTKRLYEEWLVLILYGASLLGAGGYRLIAGLRKEREDEEEWVSR